MTGLTEAQSLRVDSQHRTARRAPHRHRPDGDHARVSGRAGPVSVRVPGRHRRQAARARRAAAAAARGRRRDGRRHRPRNPQPAGVDVGIDPGAAPGAAAQRGAGAADGHRAARIRAAERHDPVVSGLRAAAAVRGGAAGRAQGRAGRGAAAAQQRRGPRATRGRRRGARRAGLVRSRREPDPPDRLEPRDQRAAGDVEGRPSAAVGHVATGAGRR